VSDNRYVIYKEYLGDGVYGAWDDDCVVLFADVLLADTAMQRLVDCPDDFALLVDTSRVLPGTMRILTGERGVMDLGGHIPPETGEGNFVGIAKFSARGAEFLRREIEAMVAEGGHDNEYFVQALPRLAARGERIRTSCCSRSARE